MSGMLSLLNEIGLWIARWQAPVSDIWEYAVKLSSSCLCQGVDTAEAHRSTSLLSTFRKACLSGLYGILPPRFVPAFQRFLRTLLTFDAPADAFRRPEHSRAMGTLVTILDRYDPILFGLIYEEIERKVRLDCQGQYTAEKLQGLLRWLNGKETVHGRSGGVMGWVSQLYAGGERRSAGEDAKKFLKPTFSRFEYHIHKVLCQLRCERDRLTVFREMRLMLQRTRAGRPSCSTLFLRTLLLFPRLKTSR